MSEKVTKEEEERAKEAFEEYKRARKDTVNNPPLRIPPERRDRFDGPLGDDEIAAIEESAKKP